MNETEQLIAIAESCGFERDQHLGGAVHWHHMGRGAGVYYADDLPDYLHDLNAMHEAEKTLEGTSLYDSPWFRYVRLLHIATLGKGEHATAAQRAEAFLRTNGKWEE